MTDLKTSIETDQLLRSGVRFEHLGATLEGIYSDPKTPPVASDALRKWTGPEGTSFLLLTGPNGTGKSYTGAAILRHFGEGVFATMPEIMTLLRSLPLSSDDADITKATLVKTLKTCPVLVLDELGSSVGGVDANELLDDVLGFRHDRGRPTVLISNADTITLADHLGPRIADRVTASNIHIPMEGESRRGDGVPRQTCSSKAAFNGLMPEKLTEISPGCYQSRSSI